MHASPMAICNTQYVMLVAWNPMCCRRNPTNVINESSVYHFFIIRHILCPCISQGTLVVSLLSFPCSFRTSRGRLRC